MAERFERPVKYKNFKGVNNRENSYRLQQVEDGIALKAATNVDLDRTGAIISRHGTTVIWAFPTRDMYTNGKDVIGVVSGNLHAGKARLYVCVGIGKEFHASF